MNLPTCFITVIALNLISCITVNATPSANDYLKFKQVTSMNAVRKGLESFERLQIHGFFFSQQSTQPHCPRDTNLNSVRLYNLDVDECQSGDLPLHRNEYQTTLAEVSFDDIVRLYPCFKNGDTVALAAFMAVSDRPSRPILFPVAMIIDLTGNNHALNIGLIQFLHDIDMGAAPSDSFFWQPTASRILTQEQTVPDCGIPSDTSRYQKVSGLVSNFQYEETDPSFAGIQLHMIPDHNGCSFTGPLNIYGGFNNKLATSFPADCSGTVYAKRIFKDRNSFPSFIHCGDEIPLIFHVDPADGTTVTLSGDLNSYKTDGVGCIGETPIPTTPAIPASSVHIVRSASGNFENTEIKHILFRSSKEFCNYKWEDTFEDGGDHVINAVDIVKEYPCLSDQDSVTMEIHYKNICQSYGNIVPVHFFLSTSHTVNHKLVIDFQGTSTRQSLSPSVYNIDRCEANEQDANLPIHEVNTIILNRESLDILDTQISSVQFIKSDSCVETWHLHNNSTAESSLALVFEDFIAKSACLSFGDVVSIKYIYENQCVDSSFWIQAKARLVNDVNAGALKIHFKTNTLETYLGQEIEFIPKSCEPEMIIPGGLSHRELPAVPISFLSIQQKSGIATGVTNIDHVELVTGLGNCSYIWKDNFGNQNASLDVMEVLGQKPCFAERKNIAIKLVYSGICGTRPTIIPLNFMMTKYPTINGVEIKLDGGNSRKAFSVSTSLYNRCTVIPLASNIPVFRVHSITMYRDADTIYNTKISRVHFYRDAKCRGEWLIKDGRAGSADSIVLSDLITSSGCLKYGDKVILQYRYADICPSTWFWMQAAVELNPSSKLSIHAAGKSVEDYLSPTFKVAKNPILSGGLRGL